MQDGLVIREAKLCFGIDRTTRWSDAIFATRSYPPKGG